MLLLLPRDVLRKFPSSIASSFALINDCLIRFQPRFLEPHNGIPKLRGKSEQSKCRFPIPKAFRKHLPVLKIKSSLGCAPPKKELSDATGASSTQVDGNKIRDLECARCYLIQMERYRMVQISWLKCRSTARLHPARENWKRKWNFLSRRMSFVDMARLTSSCSLPPLHDVWLITIDFLNFPAHTVVGKQWEWSLEDINDASVRPGPPGSPCVSIQLSWTNIPKHKSQRWKCDDNFHIVSRDESK